MSGRVNQQLRESFRGRRVLVTGDTGFKGSWLCLWLKRLGAEVAGLGLPPKHENDHYHVGHIADQIRHGDVDIRDAGRLQRFVDDFQPEYLFHLAAQSLVQWSYKDPKGTFDTNVAGSVNVLETVRKSESIRVLIYVTSDKCYRNKEWIWGYRENDELGGRDPYSASKAAAEIVFHSYLDSFFRSRSDLGAASGRAGNVVGGGDWAENRIVPDCIRSLSSNRPIILRNPDSIRPWQHVLDPLCGYLRLAAMLREQPHQYEGSWNFGPRSESVRTVMQLAKRVVECWGGGEIVVDHDSIVSHEASMLQLNCDKAYNYLQWKPRWNFDQTVARTVAWYKRCLDSNGAEVLSVEQIDQYMEETND
jgi:CDP-glucose 4,6-dehydratase